MADIKLKDFTGETQPYNNVDKIWLESAKSTEENPVLIPFAYGLPVSMTVDPNFASGDMNVAIPEGQVVADLRIQKPATLLPRNVLDGVNIAGIIGTATGNIINASGAVIRSGQFRSSNADRLYYGGNLLEGYNGAERDSNGLWKRTTSNVTFQLETGKKYYVSAHDDFVFTEPTYHSSFASYGSCLTIGNKYLATKLQSDNTWHRFLIIYIPRTNSLVEIVYDPANDYFSDGDFMTEGIDISIPENSAKTITVEHGMNTMPDFVMIWLSSALRVFEHPLNFVWGVQSKLANNTHNNYVGTYSIGPIASSTQTYSLDSAPGASPYLYCADNATFSIPPSSNNELIQLTPDSNYRWIAIWGIDTD